MSQLIRFFFSSIVGALINLADVSNFQYTNKSVKLHLPNINYSVLLIISTINSYEFKRS